MSSLTYAIASTPFGELLLAACDGGVVALVFGDAEVESIAWLGAEFPQRQLRRDDGALDATIAAALASLDGPSRDPLPLAGVGTEFQKRVWLALGRIPYGETRTYTQLAAMVDRPNAVRAVASACANNPISLLVPCHRVVGADGSLRGYRWGLERKRKLLEHEKRMRHVHPRLALARSA